MEPKLCYAVITRVPVIPNEGDGNLCDDMVLELRDGTYIISPWDESITEKFIDYKKGKHIFAKKPVFMLGEILIVDDHGREILPKMRKPNKWTVDHEVFETMRGAIHRSEEVLKETYTVTKPYGVKEKPISVYNSLSHRLNEIKTREETRDFLRRNPGMFWENPRETERNDHLVIKRADKEKDEIQDL